MLEDFQDCHSILEYGMWDFQTSIGLGLSRRLKSFKKHNQAEVMQVLDNLETYQKALRTEGSNPLKAARLLSFVRNEREGLYAIDQSPLKKGYLALRLYVFPDEVNSVIHVLLIGTKDEQSDDINACRRFLKLLSKGSTSTTPTNDPRTPDRHNNEGENEQSKVDTREGQSGEHSG